jgi:O-antigen/teichoic acid export membrane protein
VTVGYAACQPESALRGRVRALDPPLDSAAEVEASSRNGTPVGGARRILLNAGYRSLADIGGKVASFVLYVVMARKLGASEYGVFMFALSYVTIVTVLGDFGQDLILTREVSRDRGRLRMYFANTLALKLLLAVPALALAILVLLPFATSQTIEVTALLGSAIVLELLAKTSFATCQAFEQLWLVPLVIVPQRFLTAAFGIMALLLGAGVVVVAGIYLASALVALVLAFVLLFRTIITPEVAVSTSVWRPLMVAAVPLGVASVAGLVLFRVDTVMLAAFKPASVVGNYGAAYRLLESTFFLSWAVAAAVFPVFSRLSRDTEPPVRLLFQKSLKLLIAFTLPLAAGAAILAAPLIHALYGTQYSDAVTPLRLLAPTLALYPLSFIAGQLLVSQGRQRVLTVTYITVAAENILLNFLLIPTLSLNGAALGTSISQVLVVGATMYYALAAVGKLEWRRVLAGPVVATIAAAIAMAALHSSLLAAVVVGGGIYLLVLGAFEQRAFPQDARAAWSLLAGRH